MSEAQRGKSYSRHAKFTMDDELAAAIHQFQVAEGLPNQGEAVKMLCRMALSSDPVEGQRRAEMLRHANEVRIWVMNRWSSAAMEIYQLLQQSLAATGAPLPDSTKGVT